MLQIQLAVSGPGGFTATGTVHIEIQYFVSIVALLLSHLR